ncbi:MAG: hypothetical protein K0S80_1769 [Neobacillus sp.]|nr:hypothetical protein [Neobacillus sp.]
MVWVNKRQPNYDNINIIFIIKLLSNNKQPCISRGETKSGYSKKLHNKNVLLISILCGCFILCMLVQILKDKDPLFISILYSEN